MGFDRFQTLPGKVLPRGENFSNSLVDLCLGETPKRNFAPYGANLTAGLSKPAACTDATPAWLAHKVVQMQSHAACRMGL